MNEKFCTAGLSRDMISLYSIYTPMRGFKRIHRIAIYIDMISLNIEKKTKSMKEDNTICIEGKQIILNVSQKENCNGIQEEPNISVSIYNDKITSNISTMINGNHKNFTKNVSEEIECTNKIRYTVLMKIMYCLFKVCKKKDDEVSKNENKNK